MVRLDPKTFHVTTENVCTHRAAANDDMATSALFHKPPRDKLDSGFPFLGQILRRKREEGTSLLVVRGEDSEKGENLSKGGHFGWDASGGDRFVAERGGTLGFKELRVDDECAGGGADEMEPGFVVQEGSG